MPLNNEDMVEVERNGRRCGVCRSGRRWRGFEVLREEDREPFAAMNADPTVMEYFPATLSRDKSDALAERIDSDIQRLGYGFWAAEIPGEAAFIGFVFCVSVRVTGSALKHWAIAQLQDSLAIGLLWLLGLWILRIPWAPLWALLAATLQIVPHFGPILGLLGPVLAAVLRWQDWQHPFYVLMLYAVIIVVDGLLLQPYIMRRVARVPMWASILAPLVLGFVIPFWGFLLAPPLLAVIYAYRARQAGKLS